MEPQDFLLDFIDILIVAWLFYRLFLIFRQTKAIRVLIGIFALVLAYLIARIAEFEALLGLVKTLTGHRMEIAVTLLVVIFADEIKDTFAGIFWNLNRTTQKSPKESVVEEVSRACESMASNRTGALIAIALDNPLDRWEMADSVKVNGELSAQLLETIFSGKTPLHDGAVLIRQGRIVAAKCQLPQSQNPKITKKNVGMRHRAAFGLSEMSDAVVVTVSEERGWISIFFKGEYHPAIANDELPTKLRRMLGLSVQRKPWYHPRKVFANGWLKALALILATAIWAEQETHFTLVDEVNIYEGAKIETDQRYEECREFQLQPGEYVVSNSSVLLSKVRQSEDSVFYKQTLPPRSYTLRGPNWARVGLLFQLLKNWDINHGHLPNNLAGHLGIVLPDNAQKIKVYDNNQKLACKILFFGADKFGQSFRIDEQEIQVTLDKLDAVEVKFEYTGTPAKGYTVETEKPFRRPLKNGKIYVPGRLKELIDRRNLLNPCPTTPKIDVEGRVDFEEEVTLNFHEDIRTEIGHWNPGRDFKVKILLLFWSTQLEREAQAAVFTKAKRREIENNRNEEEQKTLSVEKEWLEFEKKLQDLKTVDRWAENLSFQKYELLQDQIKLLDSSIQSTLNSQKKTEAMLKAEERKENDAKSSRERRMAIARKTICKVVTTWQKDTHGFLLKQQSFLAKREEIIRRKLSKELAALTKAIEYRDSINKELPVPTLPSSQTLTLNKLINATEAGPSAGDKPASSIAKAAESEVIRDLYSTVINDFRGWFDAMRESERLFQDIRTLEQKILTDKTPIRLEIDSRALAMMYEGKKLIRDKHENHLKTIVALLPQAQKVLEEETKQLGLIAKSWDPKAVQKLNLYPFLLLYRKFLGEVPQLHLGRKDLDNQFSRAKSTLAGQLKGGEKGFDLIKETARLRNLATKVSDDWWKYQNGIHARISVLRQVLFRIADGKVASATKESAMLAVEKAAFLDDKKRLAGLKSGVEPVRLNHYETFKRSLKSVTQLIKSKSGDEAVLRPVGKQLEAAFNKATSDRDNQKLATFALRFSNESTRLFELSELLIYLQGRRRLLEATLKIVEPKVVPELKRLEKTLALINAQAKSPVAERIPELQNASQSLRLWDPSLRNAKSLAKILNKMSADHKAKLQSSTSHISSKDVVLPLRVVKFYLGHETKKLGVRSYVNLNERKLQCEQRIATLQKAILDLKKNNPRSPSDDVDLQLRARELEIEEADLKVISNTHGRFVRLLNGSHFKDVRDSIKSDLCPNGAASLLGYKKHLEKPFQLASLPKRIDSQMEFWKKAIQALLVEASKQKDVERKDRLLKECEVLRVYLRHLAALKQDAKSLLKSLPKLVKKSK
ncbi:MAG: diadenylate cyclase [Planctomycetota bacterium]|nr:diadenylate cyclase [Planctomycetota bacterium]